MKISFVNKKNAVSNLSISNYNYHLPDQRIAKYPLTERDQSKLLIYKNNEITESRFSSLPDLLSAGHLLVFNNTRVIPARLKFRKATGALIEIFCLEPVDPADYQQAFQSHTCTWKCIVGNLKKWKDDHLYKEIELNGKIIRITAQKTENYTAFQHIRLTWDDSSLSFSEIIELAGVTPIPPYLNRESEDIDRLRYQTVYSRIEGSVAAPTAGLHFTGPLLDKITDKGISTAEVTLHVGAGTFKPVQTESVSEHEMHSEFFRVSADTIQALLNKEGKIIAVGTTTLRTLESLYWIGVKISKNLTGTESIFHLGQWEAYELEPDLSYPEAMNVLLNYLERNKMTELFAYTQIMIAPGYKIRSIEALITNFHQPKSTLLLLISAITGEDWKRIYSYALDHDFRFLSYGDSSILFL